MTPTLTVVAVYSPTRYRESETWNRWNLLNNSWRSYYTPAYNVDATFTTVRMARASSSIDQPERWKMKCHSHLRIQIVMRLFCVLPQVFSVSENNYWKSITIARAARWKKKIFFFRRNEEYIPSKKRVENNYGSDRWVTRGFRWRETRIAAANQFADHRDAGLSCAEVESHSLSLSRAVSSACKVNLNSRN